SIGWENKQHSNSNKAVEKCDDRLAKQTGADENALKKVGYSVVGFFFTPTDDFSDVFNTSPNFSEMFEEIKEEMKNFLGLADDWEYLDVEEKIEQAEGVVKCLRAMYDYLEEKLAELKSYWSTNASTIRGKIRQLKKVLLTLIKLFKTIKRMSTNIRNFDIVSALEEAQEAIDKFPQLCDDLLAFIDPHSVMEG
ncbi:hypothetical protein PFISCL1PPCAC_11945, partial [Pristionchus fissidentatus]